MRSRAPRPHNVVPIEPHDNTPDAYRTESRNSSPEGRFGIALSLATIVFLVVFFWFIYESIADTYQMLK